MTEPARYWIEIGGATLAAREVRGREAISTPFSLEARFVLEPGVGFVPEAMIKAPVVIRIERGRIGRAISGIVAEIVLGASRSGAPEVRVLVEPRLALARHRIDLRIFREQSVPEIAVDVLSAIGVVPQLLLRASYPPRGYCVQLRESDLAFVSRLLEDEGIFYFFTEDGTMVLADDATAYPPIAAPTSVLFRAGSAQERTAEVVSEAAQRGSITASRVTLRDWNPDHPSLDMDATAPVGGAPGGPELYDFPGEYPTPPEGQRRARLVAEAIACAATALTGKSDVTRLIPGHTFRLGESPRAALDGEHVVSVVEHRFHVDGGGFENRFEALPARVTYRPPRITPVPTLVNPITGFVMGPPGADIHTDALGRVKVHFPWDRKFPLDDTCSDWIPVLQDNTGHSSAIPRVGWEVLVHFLEGDPDRPVVLGRVYNGTDPFPETLPANKTRSALKSLSSPGRGGENQIRFDDLAGAEQVFVHAERDQNVVVANDKVEEVLSDEMTAVKRDETIAIGSDHTASVENDVREVVDGNQRWKVGADRQREVSGSDEVTVEQDHALTIGGKHSRRIGTDDTVNAKTLKEQVGAVILEASVKTNATEAGRIMTLTVGGAVMEICKDAKSESSKARIETIGGVVFTKAGKAFTQTSKTTHRMNVGGALTVTAVKSAWLKATSTLKTMSATGAITGATSVTLKVGDTSVVLKGGEIAVKATSEIRLKVSGANVEAADESFQI